MESIAEVQKIEYYYDGVTEISAGTLWEPTPKDARVVDDATLEADEVAELFLMEVYNPNKQDIACVWPYIDEQWDTRPFIYPSGAWERLMLPPLQLIRGKTVYSFGKPTSRNVLNNTTLKYKRTCVPKVLAGATAITEPFTVVMFSYVYKRANLAGLFGTLDGSVDIVDPTLPRRVTLTKADLAGKPVTADIWDAMPGGRSQTPPKVLPLIRYATNAKAISTERDYTFDFRFDEVARVEQTMWWRTQNEVIIIVEGLGIRPHADSAYTALKIGDHYHPESKFYSKPTHNELAFGSCYPILPLDWPEFFPVPKLADPYVIFATTNGAIPAAYREDGGVVHRATGTNIAIDNVCLSLTGKLIELTA